MVAVGPGDAQNLAEGLRGIGRAEVAAAGSAAVHSSSTSSWSRLAPATPGENVAVAVVSDWLAIV